MRKWNRRSAQGPPLVFSLVWLVYLAFPLTALLELPTLQLIEGLLVMVVFIVLYVSGYVLQRARLAAVIGLLVIVLAFCLTFDASGIYMTFYAAPLIGLLKRRWEMYAGYGAMLGLMVFDVVYYRIYDDHELLVQLFPAMVVMLIIPVGMQLGQRSKEIRKKLTLANEEIARLSKNEERQRISRDLHDTLGHTLSLITLKSELAEKLIAKHPERAVQEVKDIQATSRAALKQVRELVSGMNAVTVRLEVDHAKQILAAAGIVLEQRGDLDGAIPSPLIDNILGMCLRESVTNVVKHSQARSCTVGLRRDPGSLRLTVEDNGIGLAKSEQAAAGSCNGMKGMRDRLKLIEGEMKAETAESGQGTRIVFTVPIVHKAGKTE
ncbi:sensor histidine kinase [Paenibacillus sacheonensis]|uniref:histidine kinase n=1 Tax=Paenibacillus sacheonensis TaxID=742054 RepID=A0A7X4YU98_9BACL|nr:sensor histidine kinase [Paenibacillus sacheonensis]MBM7569001.1 two-component system sensor histidine kinase DesK [Paenibacillus sacheonensis]NBC72628.1 sensor histidine kinase [Paenibacillus sacheonensis]